LPFSEPSPGSWPAGTALSNDIAKIINADMQGFKVSVVAGKTACFSVIIFYSVSMMIARFHTDIRHSDLKRFFTQRFRYVH
jgi:hypothetical protein